MQKLRSNSFTKYSLLIFLSLLYTTVYSQTFCQVIEEENNLAAITKAGDEYLVLQIPNFIWRSNDATNWVRHEIEEFTNVDSFGTPIAITFLDENIGLVATLSNPDATKASLYHTEDGGLTWSRSKLMLDDGTELAGFYPFQLFTLDEETVVMTQLFSGAYFISHDKGYTWTKLDDYLQNGSVLIDLQFITNNLWYIPSAQGLYKTTDQLQSAELLIDKRFDEFYASPDSPNMYGVVYGFQNSVLYFSDDEFSTWTETTLNDVLPDFSFVSTILSVDDILYLVERDRLNYSLDNGQSWTNANLENADRFGLKVTRIGDEVYSHRARMIKFDCESVGINENEITRSSIYPNPTDGLFYTNDPNFGDYFYTLFDASGKLLLEKQLTKSVDLSGYENGLYFLHLINNKNNERRIEKILLIK